MRVNLISSNGKTLSLDWSRIAITLLLVGLIFLLIINYYTAVQQLTELESGITRLESQLNLVNIKKRELLDLEEEINLLQAARPILEELAGYRWAELVREQGFIVLEGVTYSRIRIAAGIINIEGMARDYPTVIALLQNFNHSPLFEQAGITELRQGTEVQFKIAASISEGSE